MNAFRINSHTRSGHFPVSLALALALALGCLLLLGLVGAAAADDMCDPSADYCIRWDVTDAGGGLMTSANFVLHDSAAQPTPLGEGFSANYVATGGFETPPDHEADLVRDFIDNCTQYENTAQRDTDEDGYGNICDPDIAPQPNDCIINFLDLEAVKTAFFTVPTSANWNPDADFNGDGIINFADLNIMQIHFFASPGPSGTTDACGP